MAMVAVGRVGFDVEVVRASWVRSLVGLTVAAVGVGVRGSTVSAESTPVSDVTVEVDPGVVSTLVSDLGSVRGVVVWDGLAYVIGASAIQVVDLDSGSVSLLSGDPAEDGCVNSSDPEEVRFKELNAVTTDGEWLYTTGRCSLSAPNTIRRVDMATGATSTVASVGSQTLNDIVFASDGFLYAPTHNNRRVYRVNPSTGANSIFVTVPNAEGYSTTGNLRAITADSDSLYVVLDLADSTAPDFVRRIDLDTKDITAVGSAHHLGRSLESAGDYLYAAANFSNAEPGRRVYRFSKGDGSFAGVAGSGSDGLVDGVDAAKGARAIGEGAGQWWPPGWPSGSWWPFGGGL